MKLAVLFVTGLISFSTFAQNCPSSSPCEQAYSRLQALKALQIHENTIEDAQGNLDIVIDASKQYGISLREATDNFNDVLNLLGGSSKTAEARTAYRNLLEKTNRRIALSRLISNLRSLIQTENTIEDGIQNFEIVFEANQKLRNLEEEVNIFNELLASQTNSKTAEVRLLYSKLMGYSELASLKQLTRAFLKLSQAENTYEDAVGNLDLVVLAIPACGSLETATNDFLETLETVGGSSKTSEARLLFKKLYDL